MIKVAAPNMACQIVDWAIQVFGGGGVASDHYLTACYSLARALRLADGPDEVHRNQIARLELKRHRDTDPAVTGGRGDGFTRDEAQEFADMGLWPRPADWTE